MALFSKRKSGDAGEPGQASGGPALGELNEAEQDWVSSNVQVLIDSGIDISDATQIGDYYDELKTQWLSEPADARSDPNPLINILGSGLGQHLVNNYGMRWVIATDQYGTEMAVHAEPANVLAFPANAIAKRWASDERGAAFIPALAEMIGAQTG
jgi:ribose 5-phosphate isomerase RpiB